jgi:dihydroorotate dehydrogenase
LAVHAAQTQHIALQRQDVEKIKAGADVIQLYTGFIYEGPKLIREINRLIAKHEL